MTNPSPMVEQAVFSVTLKASGNDVVLEQATEGVADDGIRFARHLAARVTLFDGHYDSSNLFAFFYSRESVLLGRLTPRSGASGEGRYYLECLFLSFDLFLAVGADPATLYQMSLNTTRFALYRPGTILQPFSLDQEVELVNVDSLRETIVNVGLRALALLSQSVLEETQTFFVSQYRVLNLISALFSVLPIQARGNMDFAVGLYFREISTRVMGVTTPRRGGFRLPTLQTSTYYLDLENVVDNEGIYALNNPWSVFVESVLSARAPDYLCKKIEDAYYSGEGGTIFNIGTGTPPSDEIAALGQTLLDRFKSVDNSDDLGELKSSQLDFEDDEGFDYAKAGDDDLFGTSDAWTEIERKRDGEEWKNSEDQDRDEWDEIAAALTDVDTPDDDAPNSIQITHVEDDEQYDSFQGKDVSQDDSDSFSSRQRASSALEEDLFNADTFKEQLNRILKDQDQKDGSLSTPDEDISMASNDWTDSTFTDDGMIVLSPFAVLSARFPEKNVLLRRLDELVKGVCRMKPGFQTELRRFWRKLLANSDFTFCQTVREEYLRYLRRLSSKALDFDEQVSAGELAVGVVDVLEIISSDMNDDY